MKTSALKIPRACVHEAQRAEVKWETALKRLKCSLAPGPSSEVAVWKSTQSICEEDSFAHLRHPLEGEVRFGILCRDGGAGRLHPSLCSVSDSLKPGLPCFYFFPSEGIIFMPSFCQASLTLFSRREILHMSGALACLHLILQFFVTTNR